MDLGIRGRRALITGANRGIGLAVARALAAEGVDLVLVARSEDLLQRAAREISDTHGVRAFPVAADLSGLAGVTAAAAAGTTLLGGVDILVNNAGAIPAGKLDAIPDEDVVQAWNLKLLGYVRLARALLPGMRAQRWGRIVNVIGMAGKAPSAGYIWGGPANAALMNFTKGLALEAARDGVLVNAVNPGPIATERFVTMSAVRAKRAGLTIEEAMARSCADVPLGRVGRPQEVADVVVFLASERCTFVDGVVVPVAGGMNSAL